MDSESELSTAARLMLEWIDGLEEGAEPEIGELCALHPDFAEELGRLFAEWQAISSSLRDATPGLSLGSMLRSTLEPGSTGSHEGPRAADSARELLGQLASQSSAESRYQLRGEIARGGMGVVLRAYDANLRRNLAMKVILGQGEVTSSGNTPPVDLASLGRFLEEAQVTGQLEHPGIVPVHELGVDQHGRAYFTMRLVQGQPLNEIIDLVRSGDQEWTLTRALSVVLDVCQAVAFAHEKGVLHRDLKPSNIMVGRFGETYVMDWGLARITGAAGANQSGVRSERQDRTPGCPDSPLVTKDGDIVGTPAYMPPEQAQGQRDDIGPAVDIYAVGAILYHLLTGRMPYIQPGAQPSPHTILALVIQGPPTPIRELSRSVPPELEAICARAMARRSEERYPSMKALADDLRAYLENRVVKAHASGPVAELSKWVARNRAFAVAAALLLVLATGGTALFAWQQNRNAAVLAEERDKNDVLVLSGLKQEMGRLWPIHPDQIPMMESWLGRARKLVARRSRHESLMSQHSDLDPELEAWRLRMLEFLRELDSFEASDHWTQTIRGVEVRLERSRSLPARSIGSHAKEWQAAIEHIADRERSPRYAGLRIKPQLGLVPLGPDPVSGLWEFWHVETGSQPGRDPERRLVTEDDTGIVLVLIPGGSFRMGAQNTDPDAPNFDLLAEPPESVEGNARELSLDPFFLSKYEMTQGQWLALTNSNSSTYRPDNEQRQVSLRHPVETISRLDCRKILPRIGLCLPTEAQWEYAARAGTGTARKCRRQRAERKYWAQ